MKIECAERLGVLLQREKKIKILVGGRGSTKSTFQADNVLSRVSQGERWCCAREVQNSIEDSVHALLIEEIERCEFEGFTVTKTSITHESGGVIFYKGLSRNVTSLKGLNCDGLWIEEGEGLSAATIKVLSASLRVTAGKAKLAKEQGVEAVVPEIWVCMNRGSSKDPIAKQYLHRAEKELTKSSFYEDDLLMIVQINWDDIPRQWYLDSGLEVERLDDLENMSAAEYDHKWNGAYSDFVENAIIKPAWFDACVDAHKLDRLKNVFKPMGARVAAHDPFDDGDDAGGYAMRHGSIVYRVCSKTEGEIDETCDWATGLAHTDNVDWFTWDGDGMGAGLKRQVSDAFTGTKVKSQIFKGSLAGVGQDNAERPYMPTEGDRQGKKPLTYRQVFKNNRAQRYKLLADRCYNTWRCVVRGDYVDPDEMISFDSEGIENLKGLRSELTRVPTKPNANGLIQIMTKKEMKALNIDSPNEGDSVMMLMFTPTVIQPRPQAVAPPPTANHW